MADEPILCPARLYGPGQASTGSVVELCLCDGRLLVGEQRLPTEQMSLRHAGFDEAGLEFSWNLGGQWSLQVLDRTHARKLLAHLPAALQTQLASINHTAGKRRLWRRMGWAAMLAVLASPLFALAVFFAFADDIAGAIAARIPIEQELMLGQTTLAQMAPEATRRDDGEAARVVREIGQRLTTGSPYRYHFYVVENEIVNAYAMPGGFVVVHSGLIKATANPEELAGVLAHEVQHVEQRHSLKALIKQLGLGVLWSAATGDIGSTLAGSAAQNMLGLSFSRDAEREADEKGLQALVRAGIDPSGMPAFFGKLAKAADTNVPDFFSTHPASTDRQETLNKLMAQLPPGKPAPLPYSPWPPRLD